MKKLFVSICMLTQFVCFAEKKNYKVAAIAFYNLENFFDLIDDPNKADEDFTPNGANAYTETVYKEKCHNLATVLQKLGTEYVADGPAIIGVAEVENGNVLTDLANEPEIKDRNYQNICFYGSDSRGINNGLLYNPKLFQVLQAKAIVVNLTNTGDKETTRDIVFVSGILAGDTIHVLVNHWPSRRGGEAASAPKRALAAKANKHIVDSLLSINPNSKIFIMGDLNDDPVDASVAKVLGAKGDKESVKLNMLYNPWSHYFKNGIGTLGYNDSWNLFDQIMLSGSLLQKDSGWHLYKTEVFNKDFLIEKHGQYKGYPKRSYVGSTWNNGYSDHYPVIVYIVKPVE